MSGKICVFSASSDRIDAEYLRAAEELGSLMGERGYALVFGGGLQKIGALDGLGLLPAYTT